MTDLIDRAHVVSAIQYHVTDDDDRNTLCRATAALPAVKVAVKPIEWHQIHATPVRWVGHQVDASSPDYNLHLTADSPDVFAWGLDGEGWQGFCDTLEAAKAAAQADYEARILAALTPNPVDASQAADPVVNAPDPAAIREAALREAASMFDEGSNIAQTILALIAEGAAE